MKNQDKPFVFNDKTTIVENLPTAEDMLPKEAYKKLINAQIERFNQETKAFEKTTGIDLSKTSLSSAIEKNIEKETKNNTVSHSTDKKSGRAI